MSLDTDYFYRMSAPVRVLASKLGSRNGTCTQQSNGIPYGLGKEELIVYAKETHGLLLSRKMSTSTMVSKIYEAGSDTDNEWGVQWTRS
jgi:hypothetical protein